MAERRRHASEVKLERRMQAPYNFVPLPDAVLEAESQDAPAADCSKNEAERYSGVLRYRAECLTPVYTRAARAPGSGDKDDPAFYHHGDEARPYLPGSSLRG